MSASLRAATAADGLACENLALVVAHLLNQFHPREYGSQIADSLSDGDSDRLFDPRISKSWRKCNAQRSNSRGCRCNSHWVSNENGSRASGPAQTGRSSAASATERAIGPTCASVGVALAGQTGTRLEIRLHADEFSQRAWGSNRTAAISPERDCSDTSCDGAVAPPLDPPGVRPRFQGSWYFRERGSWCIRGSRTRTSSFCR